LSGVAIMFTGVAVLGVLAGSLASLFGIGSSTEEASSTEPDAVAEGPATFEVEVAALRAQLIAVEQGLGELGEKIRSRAPPTP
jgi:hypothetical protein